QPSGQGDRLRRSPAMPKDDDARGLFFPGAQTTVLVPVQKLEHGFEGDVSLMICKDRSMQGQRVALLQLLGQKRFSVNKIVRTHAATHKADDNQWPGRRKSMVCRSRTSRRTRDF